MIAGGFLQDGCHFDPSLSEPLSPMFSEEGEQLGGGGLYTES